MFKIVVGHSEDPVSLDAIKEVLEQCEGSLGDDKPNAAVMFASPDYEHDEILKHINEKFPGIQLVGCTSSGEMSSTAGYLEGSLVVALFCCDKIQIHAGVVRNISKVGQEDFDKEVKRVLGQSDLPAKLCMAFPDIFTGGLGIGFVRAAKGLQNALGEDFPIVGAGATDLDFSFVTNSEFYNNEVVHDSAPFLIFSGPLEFSVNADSGWEPFTTKKVIFEHENNVVTRIGEFPALDFFHHYLGGPPSLPYPLAIFQEDNNRESFYLRVVVSADEETRVVTLGAEVPQQELACSIAKADPERLIEIMSELINKTKVESKQPIAGAFIASCTCRQAILGTKIRQENEIVQKAFSDSTPCFGLYAYGQLGPEFKGGKSFVHNETVVVVTMSEANG